MSATQVLVQPLLAEKVRSVLGPCQYAAGAPEYARQLVVALAAATDSTFAIWLNWPVHSGGIIAITEGAPAMAPLFLCARAPFLSHDLAAAPIMFRNSIAGVLAIANGSRPYTSVDLQLLSLTGRHALLEYETRLHAEELQWKPMARRVADLVHDLRQPLGIVEACASLLELTLPAGDTRAHEHIAEIQHQLDLAGEIVEENIRGYTTRLGDSRDLANSAISMVT